LHAGIPNREEHGRVTVPTLTIGATDDTMDLKQWMAGQVKHGRFLLCRTAATLPNTTMRRR
jgi:hypothetical protein